MAEFPTIEQIALEVKDKTFEMIEEETGVSFERLIQLAVADQEGRCVVLPRKIGDFVYLIKRKLDGSDCVQKAEFWWSDIPEIGKTVFLTREEAEDALEGMKNG